MAKLSTTNIYGNLTVDGEIINESLDFDRIPYGSASGSVNVYTVTVNNFSLKDGKGISVKIPVNSTGACTLNVNGLGAKSIKKANGTDANNLKAGSIYTLRYNGTNFILQGESESGVANSAAKLTTPRGITVGNTKKNFDGSADVSWNLSEIGAVPLTGGTVTGALNLANNIYNKVGDDVAIGDVNQAGKLGIKGLNGATGIYFAPYSGSTAQTISTDGAGNMTISGTTKGTFSGNLTGNASTATKLGGTFTASGTPSTNEKTNLVGMINEVFQNASNGKSSIATAITSKGVSAAASETFDSLANKIKQISTGVNTNDATATAGQILSGATAYVKGSKITGTMPRRTEFMIIDPIDPEYNTPVDSFDIAAVDISAVGLCGRLTVTLDKTEYIDKGVRTYIKNLVPQYIKSGVKIGGDNGMVGTFTNDATAQTGHILSGQTAYVKGSKITGTMKNVNATIQNSVDSDAFTNNCITGVASNSYVTGFDMGVTGYVSNPRIHIANLLAQNIKAGVKVGGQNGYITGTFTSDATAQAGHIISGATAYVNGNKVTGNIPVLNGIRNATGVARWGDSGLAVYPERGYQKGGAGDGEIKVSQAQLINTYGITANKIISGQEIAGVWGNATLDSLGGRRIALGSFVYTSNTTISLNTGFRPNFIFVYCGPPAKASHRVIFDAYHIGRTEVMCNYKTTNSFPKATISQHDSGFSFHSTIGTNINNTFTYIAIG